MIRGRTLISGFKEIDAKIEEILKPYGLKWSEVFGIWRNFYFFRSLGRLKTDQEMFEQLRKILDFPSEKPLETIRDLVIDSHIIEAETIDVIKEIKNYYKVGIIANNIYDWMIRVLDNYRIQDLFDVIVVSSEIGVRKPDARIFVAALKALSIKPKEAVFVSDELAEDLVGAKGLGMITVWLKNPHIKSEWIRYEKPEEKIFEPDASISDLKELLRFLKLP